VVAGCRSPFCKSGTELKDITAVDLGKHAVVDLVHRANLSGKDVDEIYFGQVVPSALAPNIAREVSLLPQFPASIPAASVNRACASANTAIALGHDQIVLGHANVVIAGGAESLSDIPILHSKRFSELLVNVSKAKTQADRLKFLSAFRPKDLIPVTPAIAEPSTKPVGRDNGVRPDANLEEMAQLKPVVDKKYGTVTAANASPLTDGSAAVVLMGEDTARSLGYEPLAFIRSYAVAALDPGDQLLMGPAFAVPEALDRAGIPFAELGLVEMHEAFASQVLSNIQAFESKRWAEERLGRSEPIGEVNWDTLNVMGGSIAIGHPFGATGARITTTLAYEMKRRDVQFGLISVCAQGGMGFAMILERS
jgi:acetyl-CoA acyltransferase